MTLLESGIDSHSVHLIICIVYALWHGTCFLILLLVVTERLLNPHHDLIPPHPECFHSRQCQGVVTLLSVSSAR